jgi:hypothetical protein
MFDQDPATPGDLGSVTLQIYLDSSSRGRPSNSISPTQDWIGEVMWHESTAAAALLRCFFDYPLLYLQEISQPGNRVAIGIER